MIGACDDDYILEPPGDVELAFLNKAKIAGAQEWARRRVIVQAAAKRCFRLLLAPSVAMRNARACEPDLADTVGRTLGFGLGVDNTQIGVGIRHAAANQQARADRGRLLGDRSYPMSGQRV